MRKTSFGTMEVLLEQGGRPLCEHLIFEREGRSHEHREWEHCFVHSGSGIIRVGDQEVHLSHGQHCSIPPQTPHWMIPQEAPFSITLTYSEQAQSFTKDTRRNAQGRLLASGTLLDGQRHGLWQFHDVQQAFLLQGFIYQGSPIGQWSKVQNNSATPANLSGEAAAKLLESLSY